MLEDCCCRGSGGRLQSASLPGGTHPVETPTSTAMRPPMLLGTIVNNKTNYISPALIFQEVPLP